MQKVTNRYATVKSVEKNKIVVSQEGTERLFEYTLPEFKRLFSLMS